MKTTSAARVLAGASLIGAMACAGAAGAQAAKPAAAPAAAASNAPLGGPVIPGVCILDNGRLVQQSAVGKAVIARMQALTTQVTNELTPLRNSLQTEGQTLQAAKPAANDPRIAALQQKAANFERTAQIREREMQLTQQKALARIGTEADSVVRAVYAQKSCGMLIDRNSVFGANPAMDVTDNVIAGLNAKISTFNFDRERLPTQAAAPAAK
jgi:Skp family chaperone for outer membrane proteins